MQKVFDNLINGNLTDAKRGAKRYAIGTLASWAESNLGWSHGKAISAACYLRGEASFQAYCDAK